MTKPIKNLLWVDDDGPRRFINERTKIEKRGWTITWETSLLGGARHLAAHDVDGLIVDRLMPIQPVGKSEWAGSYLIYWLRGLDPGPIQDPIADAYDPWKANLEPTPHNQEIDILILSGLSLVFNSVFHKLMQVTDKLHFLDKPIVNKKLMHYLDLRERSMADG